MKAGADDFVTKPYDPDHLRFVVQRILERRRADRRAGAAPQADAAATTASTTWSRKSPKMRKIFDLIEQVGPLGSTVLIHGETGTGKELVAQAIHAADSRRKGPFVALNCAVAARLAAGERAVRPRAGRVHRRRPAEEGPVRAGRRRHPVPRRGRRHLAGDAGEAAPRPPDRARSSGSAGPRRSRSTSGSSPPRNKRLEDEVKAGRFRADLFYRLNVDPDRPAAAPRAARGHPAPGDALPREVHGR